MPFGALMRNGKTYLSILLRHSCRENGKVGKRTIANLTHYPPEDVQAIELALKYKGDLGALGSLPAATWRARRMSWGLMAIPAGTHWW